MKKELHVGVGLQQDFTKGGRGEYRRAKIMNIPGIATSHRHTDIR